MSFDQQVLSMSSKVFSISGKIFRLLESFSHRFLFVQEIHLKLGLTTEGVIGATLGGPFLRPTRLLGNASGESRMKISLGSSLAFPWECTD